VREEGKGASIEKRFAVKACERPEWGGIKRVRKLKDVREFRQIFKDC